MSKWAFLGPGHERIRGAAVHKGRLISTGANHFDAITKHEDNYKYPEPPHDLEGPVIHKDMKEGFITSKGRYINRDQAAKVAKNDGQVSEDYEGWGGGLLAEDLN